MPLSDSLDAIIVPDVDLGRHVIVSPSDPVSAAVGKMRDASYSCACVVDDGRLVGVFTQRDVLMRVLGRPSVCDTEVGEEMTRSIRTMGADQSVAHGLTIMRDWWVRNVPVLDADGRLVGVLTWYSVMKTIAGLFRSSRDREDIEPIVEDGLEFVDFTGLNLGTPVMISQEEMADVAIHHMKARAIGSVLVVDRRERLAGILTEFDLLMNLACTGADPATVNVADIMTPDVVTLSARSPIIDAIDKMAEHGFSHAPLVGESARPVGVASFRDIAEYFDASLETLG